MRDVYQIRRVIWQGDRFYSSLSGDQIRYPEFFIEHVNTGCIMTMEEYNRIRKGQIEEDFVDPYPDKNAFMNNYVRDGLEEIYDDFSDSLDYMTREDIIGKDAADGRIWKVVGGELVAVDDKK